MHGLHRRVEIDSHAVPTPWRHELDRPFCGELHSGASSGWWAMDTYAFLLRPLSPGWHTLKFGFDGPAGFTASYTLIVE